MSTTPTDAATMGTPETMRLDTLTPYWRNPRRITEEAVNALAQSIKRYGYQQPIVVDEHHVIVIGHTRYAALRKLGVDEVPVVVTRGLAADRVRELRVMDNRVAEYTSWDYDTLADELAEGFEGALSGLFTDLVEADSTAPPVESIDQGPEVGEAAEDAEDDDEGVVEFVCPQCFHGWEQRLTAEDLAAASIIGRSMYGDDDDDTTDTEGAGR